MFATDPLLLDVPETIVTPRLRLCAPTEGTGAALAEAIGHSLEHLGPWMPWARAAPTPEENELNIRRARARFLLREEFRYHLWREEAHVGCVGIHDPDWQIPSMEMGYWIDARHEGKGYVTEAMRALVVMATDTLGARRLAIRCDALNLRSQAVARRLGFELEGTLRQDDVAADGSGRLRDTMVFALVR